MSDRIVGIAVLDKTETPEMLSIRCQKGDGKQMDTEIPVYPDGTPKLLVNQWKYKVVGDTLHVTPSVNWIGNFHNDASWSVRFVEWDKEKYSSRYDQFREANKPQPSPRLHD